MTALFLLGLFTFSLYPFSITIANSGISANYIYVLIPVLLGLTGVRRLVWRREILLVILIYVLIYLLGIPGDLLDPEANPARRLASFLVLLFPFLLAFVEFKPADLGLFKKSVIVMSLYYSIWIFLVFVSLSHALFSGSMLLGELKGSMGSQRIGFFFCLGFFIALFEETFFFRKSVLLQKIVVCSIIFLGILLTFSRASIVAFSGGVFFFIISLLFTTDRRIRGITATASDVAEHSKITLMLYFVMILAVSILIFIVFQHYFGVDILKFYRVRMLNQLLDGSLTNDLLTEPGSSEGYRYFLANRIFDYMLQHPICGSNFKGLYLLYADFGEGASAHNQYLDVFLRTGLLGGVLWLYLVYRMARFCWTDRGLQLGLVAILIYGFMHETFKLSQGSFIFGMLLSFSYLRLQVQPKQTEIRTLNPINYTIKRN